MYNVAKHNFTNYTVVADKFCHRRNDVFKSSYSQVKTIKECLDKCSARPKCVSAEWYPNRPYQCDLSSTCTLDHARSAPKKWNVYLFIKKQESEGMGFIRFGMTGKSDVVLLLVFLGLCVCLVFCWLNALE